MNEKWTTATKGRREWSVLIFKSFIDPSSSRTGQQLQTFRMRSKVPQDETPTHAPGGSGETFGPITDRRPTPTHSEDSGSSGKDSKDPA
jgi:hypothetical protein